MGLDMYLSKKIFVGGNYEHRGVTGRVSIKVNTGTEHEQEITVPVKEISYIECAAGYWRKANQIHKWFVDNVQDGVDDCQHSYVSPTQLKELRETCEEILNAKKNNNPNLFKLIEKKLPPTAGFFFGSTEIDGYYFDDLEYTVEVLKDIDEGKSYYYHSSW